MSNLNKWLLPIGFSCIWYVIIKLHYCSWGAATGDVCKGQQAFSEQLFWPAVLMSVGMSASSFLNWHRKKEEK